MFSDIVQRFEGELNALYRERAARKTRGQKMIDLVSGNVNRAGLVFPPRVLAKALAEGVRKSTVYAPDPLGQKPAREAIAAYYRGAGVRVPPEQIVITPGTSVSFWYLFKLLANPGDEILCPRPSYPLLDSIAELCGVKLSGYRLRACLPAGRRGRWEIDFDDLRARVTDRTRAIVLISPHNPTGAVATEAEIAELTTLALEKDLPIISDEVFSEFIFKPSKQHAERGARGAGDGKRPDGITTALLDQGFLLPRPASRVPHGVKPPLVFTLNGLSKMFALPGMKIGWIAVTGPAEATQKAMRALDHISDTFLPVNEAAQFALPTIFKKGMPFLTAFKKEITRRQTTVTRALAAIPGLSLIPPEGGFYLTVRIDKEGVNEEALALDLLRKERLLVHPGYFYDLDGQHLVMSFVNTSKETAGALRKLTDYFSRISAG